MSEGLVFRQGGVWSCYLLALVCLAWTQPRPSDSGLSAAGRGLYPWLIHGPEQAQWLHAGHSEPAQEPPASATERRETKDNRYTVCAHLCCFCFGYTATTQIKAMMMCIFGSCNTVWVKSVSLLWLTWVKARWRMVSEARDCRWCCLARAKACRRRGRAVEKPDDSQWSSAVQSITL